MNDLDAEDPLRTAARAEGQERLAEHIRIWRPKAIVVVKIAIEQNVASAAREADQDGTPRYALPFPGRRAHRDRYVTELTALLKMFVEERVLLARAR
jgi:hypothetical protein